MNPVKLGKALRSARIALGKLRHQKITQTEVAGKVGVTQSYLAKLETGAETPALELLLALAKELSVEPGMLCMILADSDQIAELTPVLIPSVLTNEEIEQVVNYAFVLIQLRLGTETATALRRIRELHQQPGHNGNLTQQKIVHNPLTF